jgi:hypothetical protein
LAARSCSRRYYFLRSSRESAVTQLAIKPASSLAVFYGASDAVQLLSFFLSFASAQIILLRSDPRSCSSAPQPPRRERCPFLLFSSFFFSFSQTTASFLVPVPQSHFVLDGVTRSFSTIPSDSVHFV